VTAPSQASRRHASGPRGPAPPASPPSPPGWPRRLSRSKVTVSWGRTPPVWGSWPASRVRRASSVRASARRWPPERGHRRWAGQGRQRRHQGLAGLGVQQPLHRHHPLPGRSQPQPALLVAPLGLAGVVGVGDQPQMAQDRRSRGGSSRRPPPAAPVRPRRWCGRGGRGCRRPAPGRGRPTAPHRPTPGRWRSGDHSTAPGRCARNQRRRRRSGPSAAGPAARRRWRRPGRRVRPRRRRGRRRRRVRRASGLPGGPPAPQPQHPFGPDRIGQAAEVLGGEALELGYQRCEPCWCAGRMCVRVHGGNLSTPHPNTSTNRKCG
jgi:hypothetical protein